MSRSAVKDTFLRILVVMVVLISSSFMKKLPVGSTGRLKDIVLGALLLYSGDGLDGTAAISVGVDLSVVLVYKGGKLEMVDVASSSLSPDYNLYTFKVVSTGELELVSMQ